MPFTPFHFGPSAWVALQLQKKLDVPVFVLANVFIDLEPLLIGLYWPWLWAHGYCHTFLIGSLIGFVLGVIAYLGKGILEGLMRLLRLQYSTGFKKITLSAILGVWFHVLLDALVDPNTHPFFPLKFNPFFGLISLSVAHWLYSLCFIPVILLYIYNRKKSPFRVG
jgi:hypothetical protein